MPLYEYECFVCRYRFERLQRATAEPITECPACHGAVRRLLGVPALQFKGSGFYITDYGKGGSRPGGEDAPAAAAAASPKSDTKVETPSAPGGGDKPATGGG